jgi:hypothetical protein
LLVEVGDFGAEAEELRFEAAAGQAFVGEHLVEGLDGVGGLLGVTIRPWRILEGVVDGFYVAACESLENLVVGAELRGYRSVGRPNGVIGFCLWRPTTGYSVRDHGSDRSALSMMISRSIHQRRRRRWRCRELYIRLQTRYWRDSRSGHISRYANVRNVLTSRQWRKFRRAWPRPNLR